MTHVLVIAIGPVQDFIAAARKTRDLKNGSELLSETAKAIAKFLQDKGVRLVFPGSAEAGAPNRIVCMCESDPGALAEEARQAAQQHLRERAEAALEYARQKGLYDVVDGPRLLEQVADFLAFYCAWAPMGQGQDYAQARAGADAALAARKGLRDFTQPPWARGLPKSSLDGGRETIIRPEATDEKLLRLGIRRAEQLDGVSFVKRVLDMGEARFPSVVRIAADPFWRSLSEEQRDRVCQILSGSDDPELFQTLKGAAEELYGDFPWDVDAGAWSKPSPIQQELLKATSNRTPGTYYAVLAADGDGIGRYLQQLGDEESHRDFSRRLARFAGAAADAVRECRGALVYAGGDDVLALLPLSGALGCADRLRKEFAASVADGRPRPPTLSVGVAIVHIHENLRSALEYARAAEHAAKRGGRNALALARHTRGAGPDVPVIVHSWDVDPVGTVWRRFADLLACGDIPSGLGYELRRLARELDGLDPDLAGHIVDPEVRRIIQRKRDVAGAPVSEAVAGELVSRLTASGVHPAQGLLDLAQALVVARSLVRTDEGSGSNGDNAGHRAA